MAAPRRRSGWHPPGLIRSGFGFRGEVHPAGMAQPYRYSRVRLLDDDIPSAGSHAGWEMHPRYEEWLEFVFDHPVSDPAWYWDEDGPEFEAPEMDQAILIGETFTYAGRDLARFSDAQVNQGLWFLSSPALSDYGFSVKSETVPLEIRLAAIRGIYPLYRDCFQRRCAEKLSHLDRVGGRNDLNLRTDLNPICYMFWDVTPLGYLKGHADEVALRDAIFGILEQTLELPHLACKEAAIHGYGEIQYYYPEKVKEAMDRFLGTEIADEDLRTYAENAREGRIQ